MAIAFSDDALYHAVLWSRLSFLKSRGILRLPHWRAIWLARIFPARKREFHPPCCWNTSRKCLRPFYTFITNKLHSTARFCTGPHIVLQHPVPDSPSHWTPDGHRLSLIWAFSDPYGPILVPTSNHGANIQCWCQHPTITQSGWGFSQKPLTGVGGRKLSSPDYFGN